MQYSNGCQRALFLAVAACSGCLATTTRAQEICGLQTASFDVIFTDGFVPPTPGLGPPVSTVQPPALGVTPAIAVTYPPSGATIPSNKVQVSGTFTGPTGTGVSVNGVRAYVYNGTFLTPSFTLTSGMNSLPVQATTLDGLTATTSLSITSAPVSTGIELFSDADAGYWPFGIGFSIGVPSTITVQSVTVDFGDGSAIYTGTDPNAIPRHLFTAAGVHVVQATVTDTASNQYTVQRRVAILDIASQREILCSVYAHVRTRMAASDVTGAMHAFHLKQRHKYARLFNALGVNLPIAATRLGMIANGTLSPIDAELILVTEQAGEVSGYPLHMSPDGLGVWRIDSM